MVYGYPDQIRGGFISVAHFSMGKGLRSSVKKANKARLRSKVFGPVEQARKERLSLKLLETAQRRHSHSKDEKMVLDQSRGLLARVVTSYLPVEADRLRRR